jgi:acetyl esterase
MPIDPYLRPLIAHLSEFHGDIDYATYRQVDNKQSNDLFARVGEPGPEVKERHEVTILVAGGTIDLYIYQPFEPGPHPAHLFMHGGGWVLGTIRQAIVDAACRERCVGAHCVVVAVDYRKAPEHKFPTGLNDCYTALRWLADHAEELGVCPELITVGGQSAGGNLAAALTLKVRDEGGPPIAFQLLDIPVLDLMLSQPSVTELASGYGLTLRSLEKMRRDYLNSLDDAANPYASPLLAPDLSGLPPTHITTAEYDPLRDEGAAYAQRLAEAGVPVTHTLHPGHIHGSSGFTKVMPSARVWRDEVIAVLRHAHAHAQHSAARPRDLALPRPLIRPGG